MADVCLYLAGSPTVFDEESGCCGLAEVVRSDLETESPDDLDPDAASPPVVGEWAAPRCGDDVSADVGDGPHVEVSLESVDDIFWDRDESGLVFPVASFQGPDAFSPRERRGDGECACFQVHVFGSQGESFADAEATSGHQVDEDGGSFVDLLSGRDVILVQSKIGRLRMTLMGQVIFSQQLMYRNHEPKRVRSVALCEQDDDVLRPMLEAFDDVEVVIAPRRS